jgi:pilus assembly protein CpaB
VLTTPRVAGAGLLVGRPADEVAVHVPLADPGAVAMVRAGDHVDVLAGTGETVAASALVLAVRGADAGTGLSGGVGASLGDAGGLVLAVAAAVAGRIASAPRDEIGGTSLTVVLRSR